ncbi:thiamine kinase-like enzyme [Ilumatobacter fluminis]|uniref:Thiamine kinase-like enzyme n=1 Tax=Ilumatobacter fluminis TaxID=467091 RepID=A0A4R7HXS8_9ACTN|nr:choline/ethanolamine kinase family protein [Ilumatobacter fluminis]TDT15875.1 thiamine kinase-like enzyme [Ilumatobacter fluminis]
MAPVTPWISMTATELGAALAGLPGWPFGSDVALTRIHAGFTNINWQMEAAGRHYFVKVPGPGTDAFIDRAVANQAALSAASAGVGPAVRFFDSDSGIEISDMLTGHRPTRRDEMNDPHFMGRLFAMYGVLHDGAPLGSTKTLFDMIDEHLEQIAASGRAPLPYQLEVQRRWAPIQRRYVDAGIDLVPGHNDMNPQNYMQAPDGTLKLIDFEYAANTDRYYELGGLVAMYGYDGAVLESLLEAYTGGEVDDGVRARVFLSGIGALVKWGHWSLLNSPVRDADYDYDKHGGGMLLGALSMMFDPRCERALAAL